MERPTPNLGSTEMFMGFIDQELNRRSLYLSSVQRDAIESALEETSIDEILRGLIADSDREEVETCLRMIED